MAKRKGGRLPGCRVSLPKRRAKSAAARSCRFCPAPPKRISRLSATASPGFRKSSAIISLRSRAAAASSSVPVGRVAARLKALGARGIGQSSWGPTGFAFASDPDHAQFLARRALRRKTNRGGDQNLQRARSRRRDPRGRRRLSPMNRSGGTMAKNILHMMTPLAHMSPFDVNMALDAGYDATASYTNVSLGRDQRASSRTPCSRARRATRCGPACSLAARTRFSPSTCSTPPARRCSSRSRFRCSPTRPARSPPPPR